MIRRIAKFRIVKVLINILKDFMYGLKYFLESNLYNFGLMLDILNPYIAMMMCSDLFVKRGEARFGYELLIPIILMLVAYVMKRMAVYANKSYDVPVPYKRFTHDMGDGEITIDNNDLQEVILYLYDVEEYLKKTGKVNYDV